MVRGKQTIYGKQLRLVDKFLTRADMETLHPFVEDTANFWGRQPAIPTKLD